MTRRYSVRGPEYSRTFGDIQPVDPCTDRQLAYMHVYQPQASLDRIYVRIVGSIVSWAHASVTACEKLIHIKCWPTVQPRKETFVWYTEYKSPNISLGGNQQRRRVHAAQRARHYPSCCLYKEPLGLYERGDQTSPPRRRAVLGNKS